MRNFQLFRYLKKWMPGIILFFIVMTVITYYILSSNQKYIATAVIRYSNEDAVEGLAPDGSEIDTSEIYSSSNMAKVIENLGYSKDTYSVDQLCSSITVTPIIAEEDIAVQEALNEQGEKSEEQPTSFIVTCTMSSRAADADFVRNLLNELLNVYFSTYSEEHINGQQISNTMKGLNVEQYDYLEVVEQIDDLLSETFQTLNNYFLNDVYFHSTATGYSFRDLRDDFQSLENIEVYRLYSLIFGNKITKDEALLVSKYRDRIANYELTASTAEENLAEIDKICYAYVEKMRSSGNTDIDYNYILDDVYDYRLYQESGDSSWYVDVDHTVEYDDLLRGMASAMNKAGYAAVDIDYCKFVLESFGYGDEQPSSAEYGSEESWENETEEIVAADNTSIQPTVSYQVTTSKATAEEVETEIDALLAKMNTLFDIADRTKDEYNEYLGAQNVQMLSSVSVGNAFNMKMYMTIIAVVLLLIGCGLAVLLGRGEDILEYLFLRDRKTGCMNRTACDNYIKGKSKEVVSGGFCCVSLQIRNQREINQNLGRDEGDKVLQTFSRVLREVFENRNDSFVGYNGGGQFLIFFELSSQEKSLTPELERLAAILCEQVNGYPVAYSMGGANALEIGQYQIHALISKAVSQWQGYVTAANAEQAGAKTI